VDRRDLVVVREKFYMRLTHLHLPHQRELVKPADEVAPEKSISLMLENHMKRCFNVLLVNLIERSPRRLKTETQLLRSGSAKVTRSLSESDHDLYR
jgi:hypothetical protein